MSRKPIRSLGFLAALMALAGSTAHAQTISPILQYNFNNSGTTTSSTGTDTSSSTTLTFITSTSATAATDLHGSNTSGVSGLAGDIAFSNIAANAMGRATSNGGGQARNAAAGSTTVVPGPASANGLSSFTVQGWFKTDGTEEVGGDARIFSDANMGNTGIYVSGPNNNTGALRLSVNGTFVDSTTNAFASDLGTWTFYAATFDTTTNTVNFYRGTTTTAVAAVGTGTINIGGAVSGVNSAYFSLGNFGDTANTSGALNNRPFDGFLDDTRLYGATTGSGGALNLTQLQTIETADLANVNPIVLAVTPEPSQYAAFGLGILGLTGLSFKARKRQALA